MTGKLGRRRATGLAAAATAAVILSACGSPKASPAAGPTSHAAASSSLPATPSAPATTAPATTAPPSAPGAPDIAGTWKGTYTCSQGLTGITLTISATASSALSAVFSFYAVPSNPGVPSGSYTMTGSYTSATVSLTQGHWIHQAAGYQMVDLSGATPAGDDWTGQVEHLTGCTTFSVTK
jgi:hypothetical protein